MSDAPEWHPEQVKAAIRMTGVTLTDLSIKWGLAPDSARRALRRPWPRVELLIASHLGRKPWTIWPSRYDAKHKPLSRPRILRPSTTSGAVTHRNSERVA